MARNPLTIPDIKIGSRVLTDNSGVLEVNGVPVATSTGLATKQDSVTWGDGLQNSAGTASISLASNLDYDEFTITGGTFNGSTFIKNGTASIDDSTPDSSTAITSGTYAFFYKQGETNKAFIYNTDASQYYYVALSSGDFSGSLPSDLSNLIAYFSNSSLNTTTYDGHTAPVDEGETLGGGQLDYATASGTSGFLEFDSGNLKVSTEAVTVGSADKLPTSSSVKAQLDLKALDADVLKKDGSVALTSDLALGSNKITGLADGVADTDAATVGQVNTAIATNSVIDFVNSVAAITTLDAYTYANGTAGVGATITANANAAWDAADSDGVTLSVNDVVSIIDSTVASGLSDNAHAGIYKVTALGDGSNPWVFTRQTPADESAEWLKGRISRINAGGSSYGSKFFQYQGNSSPTIGTDSLALISVGDVSLGANSVGNTELADDAVDSAELAAGAVQTAHLDAPLAEQISDSYTVVTNASAGSSEFTLDSVLADDVTIAQWIVTAVDGADKESMTVQCMHNGTGSADATAVEDQQTLNLGAGNIAGFEIAVDIDGAGASQAVRLRCSSTSDVSWSCARTVL